MTKKEPEEKKKKKKKKTPIPRSKVSEGGCVGKGPNSLPTCGGM